MLHLELTKLWRQNKLLPGILVLLICMIGSIEASLYFQNQSVNTAIQYSQTNLAIFKVSADKRWPEGWLPDVKTDYKSYENQLTDLQHRNRSAMTTDALTSYSTPTPYLLYTGFDITQGLHAGENEATHQELLYLHRYHIGSMIPVTIRTNPETAGTNNIPANEAEVFQNLSTRYYERGWWQIWFWAIAGGLLVSLAIINLFFGDILASEWEGSTDRTRWLRLQNETHTKLILTKLAVHFGLSCLLLGLALGIFLLYAWMRTGLGDLSYPVQTWALGKRVVSFYNWMTANAEANYFYPLHIVFIPLARYLGQLSVFWVSLLFLNSTVTLLVNRILHIRLLALLTMVIVPLLGLVLPTSIYNPFTYLKGDWVITNYLGYLLNQRAPVFPWVVGIMIAAGAVCLGLTLVPLSHRGGVHFD
ncbi:hypothetical protein [Schleiferilactobacillus harbinensis]|uniref:Uncharacterized protein n=1 Tax=Schleiferilactobacillus harbinensis TaxID=304207 RepID=A0A5P8M5E0_9LACO|nr:hypothetical protein [Schleiferilactobacillus harbinensis]QFR23484.1 hypothetical protein D1010_08760 [Schleiferilactobacillus harbinensis]